MPTKPYFLKCGTRVPGVTTILSAQLAWNKNALMYWAWEQGSNGKNFRETADTEADLGTAVHAAIELEMLGRPGWEEQFKNLSEDQQERGRNAMLGFWEWREAYALQVQDSEASLISEEWKFGGTLDYPARVRGRRVILDLKTSKGTYADHRVQLASYGKLWSENYPDDPPLGYHLLQVGKEDGSFHHHYWPSLTREWEVFKHLLELHRLQKEVGK